MPTQSRNIVFLGDICRHVESIHWQWFSYLYRYSQTIYYQPPHYAIRTNTVELLSIGRQPKREHVEVPKLDGKCPSFCRLTVLIAPSVKKSVSRWGLEPTCTSLLARYTYCPLTKLQVLPSITTAFHPCLGYFFGGAAGLPCSNSVGQLLMLSEPTCS